MSTESFFPQAFVYLAAAVVAVPVAKRVGLGSVLGYLLAGVAIGPHGLGFVGEERTDVMHFAEFGVVLMLFLVGLELRPRLLWQMRGPILGLGGLQVLLSAAALAGGGVWLGLPLPAAIGVGLSLALSSTAIALQTLEEKGLAKTGLGRSAFAVLLFQDIAVIPILAVLPLLGSSAHGEAHEAGHDGHAAAGTFVDSLPGGLRALAVLGVVAFVVLAGRFLVEPLLRSIARARLREIFTAAALMLVIGIALAMQMVGLSAALGTFLAGVVLADSEFRHELEADIEPFKGLLLGVFFLAVGSSVDFALIGSEPLTLCGLVAGVLLVKGLVLFGLARAFGQPASQGVRFALLLAQGGEFAFVLLAFALRSHVVTAEISDRVIAVVALSMLVSPLLLVLDERVLQPAFGRAREAGAPEPEMPDERAPVVVAGAGRFGITLVRLLRANGFGVVVLDQDPDQIAMLEKFGHRTFYGDASRLDLLHAAGVAEAAAFVLATDDVEVTTRIAERVRHEYPHVPVLARARSMAHAYELMHLGCHVVERETFAGALELGSEALVHLGFRRHQAVRAARRFRHVESDSMRELMQHETGGEAYVTLARRRAALLEDVLQRDRNRFQSAAHLDWDAEMRRAEPEAEADGADRVDS